MAKESSESAAPRASEERRTLALPSDAAATDGNTREPMSSCIHGYQVDMKNFSNLKNLKWRDPILPASLAELAGWLAGWDPSFLFFLYF